MQDAEEPDKMTRQQPRIGCLVTESGRGEFFGALGSRASGYKGSCTAVCRTFILYGSSFLQSLLSTR